MKVTASLIMSIAALSHARNIDEIGRNQCTTPMSTNDENVDQNTVKQCTTPMSTRKQVEGVKSLTDKTFDDFIADNNFVLAMFYASWCPVSQKLLTQYDKAADMLKGKDAVLAKVECDNDEGPNPETKEICTRFGIQSYPTQVAWKIGGIYSDGFQEQDAESIVKWIKANL